MIGADETAGEVTAALVALGADLLVNTIAELTALDPVPQDGAPTYADKLTVEEFELRFDRPVGELVRLVRAGNPRPGAWCTVHGARVKVWDARVGRGAVRAPGRAAGRQGTHGRRRLAARPARAPSVEQLMADPSARLLALDALVRIEDGAYAHILVPEMLRGSSLEDRDRAFVTELVYGTVRSQRRLDDLLERASTRPVRRLDRPVRAALRLGAYQLLHNVPAHAAVDATVDAIGARSPRARGFTNGVLRALTRLGPPWPEPDDVAVRLSYPDWLVARLTTDLGAADASDALVAMNQPAALTLRPNRRAVTADALEAEMRSLAIDATRGTLVPDALIVRGLGDPAKLDAVVHGRATPQDQGSQAVVGVLDPRPGEVIADLAAAPGGKSTAIAERVGDDGLVVALDLDLGRLRLVGNGARRLALSRVCAVGADARALPLRPGAFDRVLLDAPCSGLGVLRRRADARWRISQDAIDELAVLQRELVAAAASLVRVGGVLVYSVCTLSDAETLGVDEWAMDELPEFTALAPPGAPWMPIGRGARAPAAGGRHRRHVRARPAAGERMTPDQLPRHQPRWPQRRASVCWPQRRASECRRASVAGLSGERRCAGLSGERRCVG